MTKPWTTARLHLRPFRADDLPSVAHLLSHPEVMKFSSGSLSPQAAKTWLLDAITKEQPLHLSQGGIFVGYCGLFNLPNINGQPEVELGYRLLPEHWGRGLAAEAGQEVLRLAAAQGLPRVISLIDPKNLASRRVAEKLGMQLEAEAWLPGYDHPDMVFALNDLCRHPNI